MLYFLFFLSGVAGLGYEILWTRMLAVGLGHEIVSMLAVVSAFFSGIALGAWFFDRRVSQSRNPALWYIGFELIIGLWAAALIVIIPQVNPVMSSLIGIEPSPLQHWAVAFLFTFLLLLPATAAMGGTLPAMDRFLTQLKAGPSVAGLYGANTFGAMAGTLCTTFFLLPAMGMTATSLLLAGANLIGATGAYAVSRQPMPEKVAREEFEPHAAVSFRIYLILFITGLLGIGFEVLMVRTLSQILQNTVFTFASLLTIYLLGTAAGASLYQRLVGKLDFKNVLTFLLQSTAFLCLVSIYLLRHAERLFSFFTHLYGRGFHASVAAEMTLALVLFLLPTMAMGAIFSHLAQNLRRPDGGVGRALCLNTIGGALAPVVFGLWLLPELGIKFAFLCVAGGYLLLIPQMRIPTLPATAIPVIALCFIAINSYPYRFVTAEQGDAVVFHQEGVMAAVSVIHDERDHFHLKVNNQFQMGGTTSKYSDLRQAQLPLLLHRKPKSALFLGLGTGITFSGAANYPDLEADGVELIPEVIKAMPYFEKATGSLGDAGNLKIISADARRYVSVTNKTYDVVIADLFHPARDGAGSLYTVEHFTAVRNILNPEGLFCQWLPLYQMDLNMLKVITRSFLEVFPEGQAYLAHYSLNSPIIGLIGSGQPLRYPEKWYRQKLKDPVIYQKVLPLKYDSFYSLFGTFLAGSERLKEFCAGSPLNTDAHPVVLFQAPNFVYETQSPPHERLLALTDALSPADPEAILAAYVTEEDYLARDRLRAYWDARDSFLRAGVDVEQTADVQKLYAAAREPLLAVVRKSLDFSAAYFPLLAIAYEMYPYDQEASYQLFSDLIRANPMRPEAGILRRKIFVN